MVDLGLGFSIGGKFEGFLRFLSSQKNQENWRSFSENYPLRKLSPKIVYFSPS